MVYREFVGAIRDAAFGIGAVRTLRHVLPAPVTEAFGLVTHLGNGALLVAVAVLCYWFRHDRREEYASVIAIGLGAFALVTGLKAAFVRPRPSADRRPSAGTHDGFPSAHALGSTVVWGLLAAVSRVGTRRQRYVAAGVVIAAVSLSRIVVGAHYPGDVLGGVLIGASYLALVIRYVDGPYVAFALATGLAAAMAVLAPNRYTAAAVGGSVGALLAWSLARDADVAPSSASITAVLCVGVPVAFGVRALALEGFGPIAEGIGYAVVVAGTLLVPRMAAGLERIEPARRIGDPLRRRSPS